MVLWCASCKKCEATSQVLLSDDRGHVIGSVGTCDSCKKSVMQADIIIRERQEIDIMLSLSQLSKLVEDDLKKGEKDESRNV